MIRLVEISGPAVWASALVNGDFSGLEPGEDAKVAAWLAREGVRVVDVARDAEGEAKEPRFSWHMDLHCPELDCKGGDVLHYVAEPLNPADWPAESFI